LLDRVTGKIARARRPALTGRRRLPEAARRTVAPNGTGPSPDVLPASKTRPSERSFRVEHRLHPGCSVVSPIGELDASTVGPFEEAVSSVVSLDRPIVIDLGGLSFIDSCGLWSVTTIHSACKDRGLALCLTGGPDQVRDVFEVTGLYDLLPFTDRPPAEAR
jgi:anti-sigma B factor antagonist